MFGSSGSMFAEFGSMFASSGSKSGEFGSMSASSGSMFAELGSMYASSGSKSGELGSMSASSGSMFADLGSKSGAFGSKCGGPGAAGRGECGQYIYGIGGAGWQRWAAGRLAGLRRRDMGAHCTRLGQGPLRESLRKAGGQAKAKRLPKFSKCSCAMRTASLSAMACFRSDHSLIRSMIASVPVIEADCLM